MKEKKNIDNIFNEGFKNMETAPSPRVWENIQAQLQKEKKDRKVIPLWLKLGGVAALIALLITIGNSLYDTSKTPAPAISNETIQQSDTQNKEPKSEFEKRPQYNPIASEDKTLQNQTTEGADSSHKVSADTEAASKPSNHGFDKTSDKVSEKTNKSKIASANSKNEPKRNAKSQSNYLENTPSKQNQDEGIATSKNQAKENTSADKHGIIENDPVTIAKENHQQSHQGIAQEKIEKNTSVKTETEALLDSENKKSIFDAIAETNVDKGEEVKTKKEKPEHRWKVSPNVAPVYYSSLGNGSSIDPSFADNPQKGDVNMSYGVQVSYALNNRLSVRTGLNNVDLSYSTSGIEVGTGPVAVALQSVDYGGKQIVVTAADKGSFASAAPSNGFGDVIPKSTQGEARLIQNINYYEVPVELKYALINTRFGVNVIGGLSTLFLGNNEISVKADNYNTVLGDANNLSSVSFSTNVGLGLDYKLSKKFTFNIEPMFKYQLNPYTDSSVDFKPYYLGVYSGFSFKF